MSAPQVEIYGGPPNEAWTQRTDVASSTVTYAGWARSRQETPPKLTVVITVGSPTSFASTAHGMETGNLVRISGGVGDWVGLNGTRAIIRTSADAFTVAVDSTLYSGSFTGVVEVLAPRTKDAVWAICEQTFSTGNPVLRAWANGISAPTQIYDGRASLNYQ